MIALKTRLESSSAQMLAELQLHPRIDALIHLAAINLVKDCDANPKKAHAINTIGPSKWFEAAAKANIKTFIFTSTSHVYGVPTVREPLSTSQELSPLSVYAKSKADAEKELQVLAKKYPDTRLRIARIFSVISKEARPGLLYTNLHRRAREKDFSPVPGLNNVRDFIPATEVVERLIALAHWNQGAEVVHISTGKGRLVLDLATEVFAEYGLKAEELLTEDVKSPNDIPWMVGKPTPIPRI